MANQLLEGVDANDDGQIGWGDGEGGLEQVERHMGLMMSRRGLGVGPLAMGSPRVRVARPSVVRRLSLAKLVVVSSSLALPTGCGDDLRSTGGAIEANLGQPGPNDGSSAETRAPTVAAASAEALFTDFGSFSGFPSSPRSRASSEFWDHWGRWAGRAFGVSSDAVPATASRVKPS